MDTKVTSWSDVVKKNLGSSSSPLTKVIQTTIESVAKENDKNKVLIISNMPETGNFEDDRLLLLDFIKGLQIPEYRPDLRNVVRLGRKDKDVKRLIKVTFVNEVSVKIIMAGHRQCTYQNVDWSITKELSELMKLPPDLPKCVSYRRFRVRPELPKETRDKMKINAQKVYQFNNELRSKAISAGVPVTVSFSLRQNGQIVRYVRRESICKSMDEMKLTNYTYVTKWFKDDNWTE